MGYQTFGWLLKSLEIAAGNTVKDHRASLVRLANSVRQELYLMHSEVRTVMDVDECFTVQRFCLDCHECASSYAGITLTNEMHGVEGIWKSSAPIKYHSRWREESSGIETGAKCTWEAIDQGAIFPFEVDASCSGSCIHFRAVESADTNKVVVFRYVDSNGTERTENIKLSDSSWTRSNYPVKKLILPGAVALPGQLCGGVRVAVIKDDSITELARYAPWEQVPSYRRIKILGAQPGDRVRVKANRKYHPLWFDDEIIESDNERGFINLANYIILNDSKSEDPNQVGRAMHFYNEAKKKFLGEKARDRGGYAEEKFNLQPRRPRRSRLLSRR
jgi:hypothetical protein